MTPTHSIPFKATNYFSTLICDYLDESPQLKPFYHRFPRLSNFQTQMEEKAQSFPKENRDILVASLMRQYEELTLSKSTLGNLELLKAQNTFTVVTGHQLNLFTGPLYFFYKIVSTINLCKQLKKTYPESNFVPIYWMATEDHDFEEINFFNFNGKKIQWTRDANGMVGELNLNELDEVFSVFSKELNLSENASKLKELFKQAYLEHNHLTEAMRFLVNQLFGDYGLVIVDGNDADLKAEFAPYMKEELTAQTSHTKVMEANEALNQVNDSYKIQVNPREINLFYVGGGIRERIVLVEGRYLVNDTDLSFSEEEILELLEAHPERFSPNVIMRPLYQEVILPNLCYIGGGGELAYWLQLKSFFETQQIPFPMLLLRNSALLLSSKQLEKLERLNVSIDELFLKQSDLKTKVTRAVSEIDIDFSDQKKHLEKQFKDLYELAEKTDKSFKGAVAAQETKQIKGLENLEKRLLKAQKRKLEDHLNRVTEIQSALFPNGSLQERQANFSEFYLEYGHQFQEKLLDVLNPLESEFVVLKTQ